MKGLAEIPMRLVVFTLLALSLAIPVLAQDPKVIEGKPVVLDGDTLMFGDQRVRLWGIDAPEMSDWSWGAYARATLDAIISAKPVRCEVTGKDGSRLVARCFTPEAVDLGAAVIAAGWAIPHRLFTAEAPDALRKLYDRQEAIARQDPPRGIWRDFR